MADSKQSADRAGRSAPDAVPSPAGAASGAPARSPAWLSQSAHDVLTAQQVSANRGLSDSEVRRRRQRFGPNRLQETARRKLVLILLAQFKNIVIALLLAAGLVALAFGDLVEAFAIFVVIAINAGIGFGTELRAVRSIEALRRLGEVHTTVRRNGS